MPTAPRRTLKRPAVPTEPAAPIKASAIVATFAQMAAWRTKSADGDCVKFAGRFSADDGFLEAVTWLAGPIIENRVAAKVYSEVAARLGKPDARPFVERLRKEEVWFMDELLHLARRSPSRSGGIPDAVEDCHREARSRAIAETVEVIRKYLAGQIDDDLVTEVAPDAR